MKRSHYLQILNLIRIHQQKNKFVSNAYGTDLSISELMILSKADIGSNNNAKIIALELELDKSAISRSISRLTDCGYLKATKSLSDARKKELHVTPKGQEVLRLHDHFNNELIENFSKNLNLSGLMKLQSYFKILSDGFNIPEVKLRANENPILFEIRRLSLAFKIYGNSFVGSGYSSLTWQIFSEISSRNGDIRAKDLADIYLLPINTLSQMISKFVDQGIITKSIDDNDRRNLKLLLTNTGKKILNHIEQTAEIQIQQSLSILPEKEIKNFILLFSNYLGLTVGNHSQEKIKFRVLRTQKNLTLARGFLIENLLRLNLHFQANQNLIASDSSNFALFCQNKIEAICEIDKDSYISNFIYNERTANTEVLKKFVQYCLKQYNQKKNSLPVKVYQKSLAFNLINKERLLPTKQGYHAVKILL